MAPLTVAIGALVLAFVGLSKPLHPLIRRLLPKQGEGVHSHARGLKL